MAKDLVFCNQSTFADVAGCDCRKRDRVCFLLCFVFPSVRCGVVAASSGRVDQEWVGMLLWRVDNVVADSVGLVVALAQKGKKQSWVVVLMG